MFLTIATGKLAERALLSLRNCIRVALASLLLCGAMSATAHAQTIKPLDVEKDPNGVDLLSGQVQKRLPELSAPGSSNLRLGVLADLQPVLSGTLIANTNKSNYDINAGRSTSQHFDCVDEMCTAKTKDGSQLIADPYGKVFEYHDGPTGAVIMFNLQNYGQGPITPSSGIGFYPSYIRYPSGETISFQYSISTSSTGQVYRKPTVISSNLGYAITLAYANNTFPDPGWSQVTQATLTGSGTTVAQLNYSTNTVTDLAGRVFSCTNCGQTMAGSGMTTATSLRLPGEASDTFAAEAQVRTYGTHAHGQWVTKVTQDGVDYNYSYVTGYDDFHFSKVTITAPEGFSRVVNVNSVFGQRAKITSIVNSLNQTTSYEYGNDNRVIKITYPEGNSAGVTRDLLGNITESRMKAKASSGLADIVETANYVTYLYCVERTCFRPTYTIDAKGQRTDYSWDPNHGELLTKLEPADANGQRRKTINEYDISGLARVTKERVCFVDTAGANLTCGTAAERVRMFTYGSNFLPLTDTVTDGVGSQSLTTTNSYDAAGRLLSKDGPAAGTDDASYYRYDVVGRKTWEIGAKRSDGYRPAVLTSYRYGDDQPLTVEKGVVVNPTDTALIKLGEDRLAYNDRRLPIDAIGYTDGVASGRSNIGYDALNRSKCSAIRMNPASWGGAPTDGCVLGTSGSQGADRITKTIYDSEGRVTTIQKALGTPRAQDYVRYTYTVNGKQDTVTDANGNLAKMTWDGFDRQLRWYFPSKTATGSYSTTDYEEYGYDVNSNRISMRKRDGSVLTYQYDAVNRMTLKVVPARAGLAATHTRSVYYGYGIANAQTYARFDSASGEGVTNSYDSLGRLVGTTTNMDGVSRSLAYALDTHGNRTALTWMDGQLTSFAYDAADNMQKIFQGAAGSGSDLWTYASSNYGKTLTMTAQYGQASQGQADGSGRLLSLTSDLLGSAQDNVTSFSYNAASQIASRTISNDAWAWTAHVNLDRPYAVNGLNQYTSAGAASFAYDANGNLASDGTTSYLYDIENRLVSASGGATAQLRYDPLGRLYETAGGAAGTTRFLYDGDELVAEYNTAGTLLRRYVHGASVDDSVVWYEGASTGAPRWLQADHQGSIVAVSSATGVLGLNSYDEYGIPENSVTGPRAVYGRFAYTGQAWIPELGMYHYKARIYSPTLGRFLQTDPIGYKDQVNLYAYVGNDPVNATDPDGQQICGSCSGTSTDGLGADFRELKARSQNAVDKGLKAAGQALEKTGDALSKTGDTLRRLPGNIGRLVSDPFRRLLSDDDDWTKVGRWMSPVEADNMIESGQAQPNAQNVTFVSNPADPHVWRGDTEGRIFVTFKVPTDTLRGSSRGVSTIIHPGSNRDRYERRLGQPGARPVIPVTSIYIRSFP